jgi:hypothetical protein
MFDAKHTVPKISSGVGRGAVLGGDVSAGETYLNPKPVPDLNTKPAAVKQKRVASLKMQAALLRARKAKAEIRRSLTEAKQSQFFFDIV